MRINKTLLGFIILLVGLAGIYASNYLLDGYVKAISASLIFVVTVISAERTEIFE